MTRPPVDRLLPGLAALRLIDLAGFRRLNTFRRNELLLAVAAELDRRGIVFALARVKRDLLDDLDAFGLTASIGPDRLFPTLPTAVAAYRQWRDQHRH